MSSTLFRFCAGGQSWGAGRARAADLQEKFAKFDEAVAFVREALVKRVTAEARSAGAGKVAVDCQEKLIWEGMMRFSAWSVGKPASSGDKASRWVAGKMKQPAQKDQPC
jgi:hypothetical protein